MSEKHTLKLGTGMNCAFFEQWILLVIALVASSAQAEGKKDITFIGNYCVKCHNA